ncbi:MAG: hypothetical protein C5B54_04725 [Acidobacteria bacterium]|nr:MAG: hypothetical protein C5B54_04725 [Acidobacteriota bacterium]
MMNPGVTEEAGQTAREAISVFRSQPLVLALVLMNIGLLGLMYWDHASAERERVKGLELLYENRKYVGELLAHCWPEAPRPDAR